MAPRKLVVLCDGTFNSSSDDTNVFRFKNALSREGQVVYYDEGVGVTEEGNRKGWFGRTVDSLMGGAFGSGLSMNVQQGYRWVCEHYEDGDELYFLGFSRGAFTARSTVGMIRKIGLIRAPIDGRTLEQAFSRYRDEHHPDCPKTVRYRHQLNTQPVEELSLRFLGVWDTVGALGLPVVGPRSLIARRRWGFHDTHLSSHGITARQALAVDEKRAAFLPAPWCFDPERQRDAPESVQQRWFAGCHSDIGGRNGRIAFDWMIREAGAAGLTFRPPLSDRDPPTDPQTLHESLSLMYQFGTGAVSRPIQEEVELADGQTRPRFFNEEVSPTAYQLRRVTGKDANGEPIEEAVPLEERENLNRHQQGRRLRGPKPGWGLALSYYLDQYGELCQTSPDCCQEYTDSKKKRD